MELRTQSLIRTRKKIAIFIIICLYLQLSTHPIIVKATSQQSLQKKWCVEIGDSRSFVVTKFYDTTQPDPHKLVKLEGNEDHEFIYITTEVNTKITYTITELPGINIAMGKRTINDTITLKEEPIQGIVTKTVQNKTYWELIYVNESTNENISGVEMGFLTTVTNKLIIQNVSYQSILPWFSLTELINYNQIIHWEWVNGWLSYRHTRYWNENNTFYEYELKILDNSSDGISWNIFFGGIILLGITGLIVIINYQLRKRK